MTEAARESTRLEPCGHPLPPSVAEYCRRALPHVSRTFALTIPLLRDPLRDEVGLAYLLCRVVDTIEDHPRLAEADRNRELFQFLEMIHAPTTSPGAFDALPPHPDPHHDELLRRAGLLLEARRSLRPAARRAIDACLWDMAQGMTRFRGRRGERAVHACDSLECLESYCHVVAGTVGLLLTDLFAPWFVRDPDASTRERGRRFGLGLQLTNVLKDAAEDSARGVIYLPPPVEPTAAGRDGMQRLVARTALTHLDAGEVYVREIPADCADLRLFCLWALHLALATLHALHTADDGAPARASREALAAIQEETRDAARDDDRLRALYARRSEPLRVALRADAPAALRRGGTES